MGYQFETGPVVLLSAPGTNTAFVAVTAQHDPSRREFRLPFRTEDRLFRIGAAVPAVVIEDRAFGQELSIMVATDGRDYRVVNWVNRTAMLPSASASWAIHMYEVRESSTGWLALPSTL